MKLLRIIPDGTTFKFMSFRLWSFPFSAFLSIVAVVAFFSLGMNFEGGRAERGRNPLGRGQAGLRRC
jgi:preprotein translocase subunit SecF